ncbi:MAG: efflux RND transporter permease subunit [Planctomycetaceae bacterium]|nr:efflux RND transporter permease subunit [Planctomycetaceae bacterium]
MLSHFFIRRPIFAAVVSIIITLAGALSVFTLPIAQYPEITPPTVQVTASYPGANAQLVLDTVAAPIEQQVNGVENMLYMSSQCTNDGQYTLTVTFQLGTDLNIAQVLVQNRVQLAMPVIPSIVQLQGVAVKKKSPSIMMIVNLFSTKDRNGRYRQDDLYLSNYATIQIRDELLRLPGVGDVTFLGERDYSMRAWLDPEKLATRNMTADDVVKALKEQNVEVAAGQVGQPPVPRGQNFQLTMNTLGRLIEADQFGDIVLKSNPSGDDNQTASVVRLRDVARVERGAQQYDQSCTLDMEPSVALSIYQLPGSNAVKTANAVYAKMAELKHRFPEGLDYKIVYDTTPFIYESVSEVLKTLRDAILLVSIVVLVFLQNWRAAIIPLIAVPVAIIGTFAVMAAMGFSLNNLSLFGLVLAIGIVVDDAIVVVENVERWLAQGLSPRDAADRAMEEVTGPVIAVALVLCAVFVPCAFISGITGQFFRQFALTIAVSTVISALNSLTLSPALAALLLKPHGASRDWFTRLMDVTLGWFFRSFNWGFSQSTSLYVRSVGMLLRTSVLVLLLYGGLLVLTWWGMTHVPSGFIPNQDKGYLLLNAQLPDGSAVERTRSVMSAIEQIAHKVPGVAHTVSISGQSLLLGANAPNFGSMYVMLDEFANRRGEKLTADAIAAQLRQRCEAKVTDALVSVFGAPPVDGLGNAGGFKLMIEDRGNLGLDVLQAQADKLVAQGNATTGLDGVFTSLRANTPWIYLDIDRIKAKSMGVSVGDVFDMLQVYVGSLYVNNFNEFGRSWQVNVQADSTHRRSLDDILQMKVRNQRGEMVPLATMATASPMSGPVMVMRYNMYPAAAINGAPAPGVSSGQAISLMENVGRNVLLPAMELQWTELTYMQILAGSTAMTVFALAVVLVFLVLAAQYESWSLPLAVILVVPMCLLCSIAGVAIMHMDVNIFTQIGFVVLVGLASKNAILVVEFARQQRQAGVAGREATLEACRLRLRPIMMTSLAFILGVVPLVIAEGAGAEMRRTLGTAVFSGMLGVTLFGIFLTPVFFFAIDWLTAQNQRPHETGPSNPAS